ncbi:MAG: hypothetical protein KTR16_12545 [Acidiferrobacterales bacterium]|nr:hypothetical protein [Acidiferrobacterales bacterium]
MEKQKREDVEVRESSQKKLEWRAPELVVISMDKTETGTFSIGPNEGTFYAPS